MAKTHLKIQAQNLRKSGLGIKNIAEQLNVSKSTASLWTRDISLTTLQSQTLIQNRLLGAQKGRFLGSEIQKQKRLEKIEFEKINGKNEIPALTIRELKLAGLALYWAEGSKKHRKVELCNSDPQAIIFYIKWLKMCYDIKINELGCYIGINEAHRERETTIKDYWSEMTKIPISQFTKTSFKKYPLKKEYSNFNEHFGTLSVHVRKPARIYYKILGEIDALSKAT